MEEKDKGPLPFLWYNQGIILWFGGQEEKISRPVLSVEV